MNRRSLVSALDDVVVELFNTVRRVGKYPEAWRIAALMPLLKGGTVDASQPSNYRGIALLVAISKLFATLLEQRIVELTKERDFVK